jgi:organic hydroperoxide reductase OsmC/OhrA
MSTIAPFPHHYRVRLAGRPDGRGSLSVPEHPEILGGAPPQFGGMPTDWSPEELLLGAVSLCLMKSFDWMRERAALAVSAYGCECEGVLEKTREGLVLTSIVATINLTVADAETGAQARKLMEQAKRYCIISSSLKPPVEMRINVEVAAAPAPV